MTDIKTSQPRDARGRMLPKLSDTPMKAIMDAANSTLRRIRELHPEVPNVVLVVGSSSSKVLGHYAPQRWDGKQAQHEIMLSGEGLARGAEGVLNTLIHECAHALAGARDIKDTSRNNRWHNDRFKLLAEELGMEAPEVRDSGIGWSYMTLPKATETLYKVQLVELRKALKTYRVAVVKTKATPKNVRVECACRAAALPITFVEKGDLHCVECDTPFIVMWPKAVAAPVEEDEAA